MTAALLALAGCSAGGDGDEPAPDAEPPPTLADCAEQGSDEAARACYLGALTTLVDEASDPGAAVQEATEAAWSDPDGFLLPNCHGLMHTVGREYAAARGVTLATLMEHLPRSNDPGCPAGFAHGVISAIAPELGGEGVVAVGVCDEAETRYQRYSCRHGFGHAFMRAYGEELGPALALCRSLGPPAPECAQGVFHDYWFSVAGFDGTEPAEDDPVTDPRELCAAQREEFVRACWHRAFLESRPAGFETAAAAEIEALCAGLAGVQRSGCVTAASAVGPPQPARQLALCSELDGADAVSCIRGVKVQNLLNDPEETYVEEIRYCDLFYRLVRRACYRWYGQALAVLTDGRFDGCAELDPEAARARVAGTQALEAPLETFS